MNPFLSRYEEKSDFNQYWYSPKTIEAMVQEVEQYGTRVAFLSTPSIYFSLPRTSHVRQASYVFDLDEGFAKGSNFVKYDFKDPEGFPADLRGSFDMVVIDPPFITEEVWALYAQSSKALLKEGGKVLLSTIPENEAFLRGMLGVEPQKFKPSIPHLVYQYCLYCNYESERLAQPNPEIPEDD